MARPLSSLLSLAMLLPLAATGFSTTAVADDAALDASLQDNRLVAWCIVPFDATRRGPEQRAVMLKELGLKRCAYDWRDEHVPQFEQEIESYKKHGIEFFAFWGEHPAAFALFEKHKLHPQIWKMMPDPKAPADQKIEATANALKPLAERTKRMGCKLGIYNHGGWAGQPQNMTAVCKLLRQQGYEHVGIVYNFHHGHEHIAKWPEHWALMNPYVHCLNTNGMNATPQPKILGLAQGQHELAMLNVVRKSGYKGPIGILDHRSNLDAKESLQENINGMGWLRAELKSPGSGGLKPTPPVPAVAPAAIGATPFTGSMVVAGKPAYRTPPLTVSCHVTLPSKRSYNILVANETKQSPSHWELFTVNGSGKLAVYLPGRQPDHVHSEVDICDNQPHRVQMLFEQGRVQLHVDGKKVADQTVKRVKEGTTPGGLAIGRLVEGTLGCSGHLDWVDIRKGAVAFTVTDVVPAKSAQTIEQWKFERPEAKPPLPSSNGVGSLEGIEQPYSKQLVQQLLQEANQHGDAIRGARVFTAARFACLSCHKIGETGGIVGPSLEKQSASRKPEALVESILWPRRTVEPAFLVWHALLDDGQQIKGYRVASKDDATIVLKDPATGSEQRLAKEDVVRLREAGTLMPDGLTRAMTRQQTLDLIRFVTQMARLPKQQRQSVAMIVKHSQHHAPVGFEFDKKPLTPRHWPSATHPVNRDRIYDFYAKQADHFRNMDSPPMVLSAFPGLDGGDQGHWGNQNETTWADSRWNDVKLGSLQCGVFRGAGKTVARGVCVRLPADDNGDSLSACFNPDTLTYEAVWRGGFVSFSGVRHGFMHGLKMEGRAEPYVAAKHGAKPSVPYRYRGFYRHGAQVVFAYELDGVPWLDAPRVQDGQFHRIAGPRESHPLKNLLRGAEPQWPQVLERPIHPSSIDPEQTHDPYVVDTFELPTENPWNALMFCGGHDFLANGDAVICTMHGDVWRVEDRGKTARWRRIASGLHHLLGLVVHDDVIYVQGRDQITRLHDINGDGEADFYENLSHAFSTSAAGHDFICGLERDAQGRFYTASGNQGLLRISADGERVETLATGFRNPDGLGLTPDGLVTVPCSEGGWTPASQICAFYASHADRKTDRDAPYFGWGGPKGGKRPALPMVYLPRGLDNSSGGQLYVESEQWGPLSKRMLHFSFGAGQAFLLLHENVDGQLQGAVVPLDGEFLSGAHRGRFHPVDGQLYVSGMAGWGSYTTADGCFQRVRHTGQRLVAPTAIRMHENGVHLVFASEVASTDPQDYFAQAWNYRYSGAYGSPEFSTSHPGVVGHDPIDVTRVIVGNDGRSVFLEMPDIQPCSQLHLRMRPNGGSGRPCDVFATVHRLRPPFSDYAGYQPVAKRIAAHPMDRDLAMAANAKPNPWSKKQKDARRIRLETGKNLTYKKRIINAAPGETLALTLANPDVVPHNWALLTPGSLIEVGNLANRLIADPDAYARQYVPQSKKVLVYTDVVGPGADFTIYFKAPTQPGRYPYLCTFPGHWMVMNGELVVK